MTSDINSVWDLDLIGLTNVYKNKKFSPKEVVQQTFERIKEIDGNLNAFITICSDNAIKEAEKVEREMSDGLFRGPLHGVPIVLKDLIYTKNLRTTMGSGVYKDYLPEYDATIVNTLKQAGAIIIGKTNTHELAYGPTGDYSYFGSIKNPLNLSKIAGGSSSGSAAAIAASLSFLAIGTDTSGSVRIPSSCCGIVGMKPTFGRISKYGVYPLSWTMDHVGPLTKNVTDNAILLNHLIGYDNKDPYSVENNAEDFTIHMKQGIEGSTIGIPLTPYFDNIQKEVKEIVFKAISIFESLGAKTKILTISDMDSILEACKVTTRSEAYVINKNLALTPNNLLGEQTRERILAGADYSASEFIEAQQVRNNAIQSFDHLLQEVDVIITPTLPILPTDIGQEEVKINNSFHNVRASLIRLTCPTNLTGHPSLTIPCGYSSTDLPIGMQLIGKRFDEATLYRFGYAFEQAVSLDRKSLAVFKNS